jgi:hypothetical protein
MPIDPPLRSRSKLIDFRPLRLAEKNMKEALEPHSYHSEEDPEIVNENGEHLKRAILERCKEILSPHPSTPI